MASRRVHTRSPSGRMARKPASRRKKAEAAPEKRVAPVSRAARKPAARLGAGARPAAKRREAPRREETRGADEAAIAALKREVAEKRIEIAKLGVFDVDGIFRGKYVALDKLWSGARKGLGFCDVVFGWDCGDRLYDNARLTGWHTGYPDAVARVDLSTYRPIPWETGAAAFLLDVEDEKGRPHPASPRGLLKRMAARAQEMGFAPRYSYEFEFFLFRETPETVRRKGYRNLRPISPGMFGYSWLRSSENAALVHDLVDGCKAFRIPIEAIHTETGPGVYEVAIAYDDVVEAADRAALFKTAAKEICSRHGVMACFMAKWNAELPGCSGHVHQSLWSLDRGRNLFFDPKGERGMSATLRHFLAGQLELMPELTALVAPTVNSYKRYVPGVWAPLNASWGFENRTCALRVIGGAEASSMRIEHRQPAADSNPYLAMATLLAAGLYGIEHRLEPPAGVRADATAMQAPALPRSLDEAVARLERSERARELLGDEFVDHYVRTRQWEARQYQQAVTSWELERYFEII